MPRYKTSGLVKIVSYCLLMLTMTIWSCSIFRSNLEEKRSIIEEIPFQNLKFYNSDSIKPSIFNSTPCKQSYISLGLIDFDLSKRIQKRLNKKNPFLDIRVKYGNDEEKRFIANPELIKEGYFRSIKNKTLSPPIPYTGGNIELSVSLKLIPADKKIERLLGLLQRSIGIIPDDISRLAELTGYSSSIIDVFSYVDSLSHTAENVFSINTSWNHNDKNNFKEGCFIVYENAESSKVDANMVSINKTYDTHYSQSDKVDYPFSNLSSYVVFQLHNTHQLDTRLLIDTKIDSLMKELDISSTENNEENTLDSYSKLKKRVLHSKELTTYNQWVILGRTKSRIEHILKSFRGTYKLNERIVHPCNLPSKVDTDLNKALLKEETFLFFEKSKNPKASEISEGNIINDIPEDKIKEFKQHLSQNNLGHVTEDISDWDTSFIRLDSTKLFYFEEYFTKSRESSHCDNHRIILYDSSYYSLNENYELHYLRNNTKNKEVFSFIYHTKLDSIFKDYFVKPSHVEVWKDNSVVAYFHNIKPAEFLRLTSISCKNKEQCNCPLESFSFLPRLNRSNSRIQNSLKIFEKIGIKHNYVQLQDTTEYRSNSYFYCSNPITSSNFSKSTTYDKHHSYLGSVIALWKSMCDNISSTKAHEISPRFGYGYKVNGIKDNLGYLKNAYLETSESPYGPRKWISVISIDKLNKEAPKDTRFILEFNNKEYYFNDKFYSYEDLIYKFLDEYYSDSFIENL